MAKELWQIFLSASFKHNSDIIIFGKQNKIGSFKVTSDQFWGHNSKRHIYNSQYQGQAVHLNKWNS